MIIKSLCFLFLQGRTGHHLLALLKERLFLGPLAHAERFSLTLNKISALKASQISRGYTYD